MLSENRNWIVGLPSLFAIGVLFLDIENRLKVYTLSVSLVLQAFVMVKPIKIGFEDAKARDVAQELNKTSRKEKIAVATSHATIRYFLSPKFESASMNMDSIQKMSPGDYILWDSHYSKRAGIDQDYLISDTSNFTFVKQEIAENKRFGVLVFKKK